MVRRSDTPNDQAFHLERRLCWGTRKVPTMRASGANECLLPRSKGGIVLFLYFAQHEVITCTSSNNLLHPDQPPHICLIVYSRTAGYPSPSWHRLQEYQENRIRAGHAISQSSDVRPGVQRGYTFVQQIHCGPLSYKQMLPRYANEAVKP
jgi:hypothetical protein